MKRLDDAEVLAYTLIEIACIRCEELSLAYGPQAPELQEIQRDLGLSGYHACAELPTESRYDCVALARDRCNAYPLRGFTTAVEAVFEGAVGAADALADVLFGLEFPGDGELTAGQHHLAEIHAAHVHALSASESLDRLVSELRER